MGTRLRKSVKVAPGVRLNFSKSGMSVSAGPKGAKVNISKKGTYLTTSVPGTGIYSRKRISSPHTRTKQYRDYSNSKLSEGSGPIIGFLFIAGTALFIYWSYLCYANSHWIIGSILALISVIGLFFVFVYFHTVKEEIDIKKSQSAHETDTINTVADVANDIWTPEEAQRYSNLLDELNEQCELMDKATTINDLDIYYNKALSIFTEFEKTTLKMNGVSVLEAKQQLIDAYEDYKKNLT